MVNALLISTIIIIRLKLAAGFRQLLRLYGQQFLSVPAIVRVIILVITIPIVIVKPTALIRALYKFSIDRNLNTIYSTEGDGNERRYVIS